MSVPAAATYVRDKLPVPLHQGTRCLARLVHSPDWREGGGRALFQTCVRGLHLAWPPPFLERDRQSFLQCAVMARASPLLVFAGCAAEITCRAGWAHPPRHIRSTVRFVLRLSLDPVINRSQRRGPCA